MNLLDITGRSGRSPTHCRPASTPSSSTGKSSRRARPSHVAPPVWRSPSGLLPGVYNVSNIQQHKKNYSDSSAAYLVTSNSQQWVNVAGARRQAADVMVSNVHLGAAPHQRVPIPASCTAATSTFIRSPRHATRAKHDSKWPNAASMAGLMR